MDSSTSLSHFLGALQIASFPLALIVTKSDTTAFTFPSTIPTVATGDIDQDTDVVRVDELLIRAATEKVWLKLNLMDGSLPPHVYNQLRSIATIAHATSRSGADVRWPKEAKIVVLIRDADLKQMVISTFMNLFGSVYREA